MSQSREESTPDQLEKMRKRAGKLIQEAQAMSVRKTDYSWATYTTLEMVLPNGDGISFQVIKRRRDNGPIQR